MRAAQLKNSIVVNYAEVDHYFDEYVDPMDSVIGSTYSNGKFKNPKKEKKEVPQFISSRQGLQQLRIDGITSKMIEDSIMSIEDVLARDLAMIEFKTASVFDRNRPLVNSIGAALKKTPDELDDLFIKASKIT